MPVSREEYQRLIQRELARYKAELKGGDQDARDRAVRSANIAAGYGSSTALKHPARGRDGPLSRESQGGQDESPKRRDGGGGGGGGRGVPVPRDRPSRGPTTESSYAPSRGPTTEPSYAPSRGPTTEPGFFGARGPTTEPSYAPSRGPTTEPGFVLMHVQPEVSPSVQPLVSPSVRPLVSPSLQPAAPQLGGLAPTIPPTVLQPSPSGAPSIEGQPGFEAGTLGTGPLGGGRLMSDLLNALKPGWLRGG